MRLFIILTCIFFSLTLFLGLTAYTQRETIAIYKEQLFTLVSQNLVLKSEVTTYKEQAKNLRQIIISANTPQSKNMRVGDIIYKYTNNTEGQRSVYFKNLTTSESVIVDGDRSYYMASLYKVIVTLYILEAEKKGALHFTDTIGSPKITIEQALQKIITESNNEYAQAIAEKYGWKKIEAFIEQQFNIQFSFNKDLQINVKHVGYLFESIAQSIRLSDTQSDYLLQLLNKQQHLSKLPKYLPKHIYSHNKTGEYGEYSHDAGIFYTPKANYVLVFMSKTKNPSATDEQMAHMSKEIYEALNDIE